MPEIEVNIEVYCAVCGEGLCNQTEFVKTYRRGESSFRVEPCSKCLQEAKDQGYEEGYEEAKNEIVEERNDE